MLTTKKTTLRQDSPLLNEILHVLAKARASPSELDQVSTALYRWGSPYGFGVGGGERWRWGALSSPCPHAWIPPHALHCLAACLGHGNLSVADGSYISVVVLHSPGLGSQVFCEMVLDFVFLSWTVVTPL